LILSISGSPVFVRSTPLPKSHSVLVNLAPPVGVELVASKTKPYHASSGVNFNSSLSLSVSLLTLIISDAIFSFTTISALERNGKTSVKPFEFLCDDVTSKNAEKVPSSLKT
jgi:hypothetical protein